MALAGSAGLRELESTATARPGAAENALEKIKETERAGPTQPVPQQGEPGNLKKCAVGQQSGAGQGWGEGGTMTVRDAIVPEKVLLSTRGLLEPL